MPPLPSPAEDRQRFQVSTATFLATAAMIPPWMVTVLPMSILYQLATRPFRSAPPPPQLDSGYVVTEAVIPREKRTYDMVVLGATGFTGRLAVLHLAQTYGTSVRWAVAGRSEQKLKAVLKEVGEQTGVDLSSIDIIVVDTSVPATMPNLVRDARCVATTVGPYALYGHSVVEFCAKWGTHYVDITGEVDWVKTMMMQWQETAQKTGAQIISFCGHDSIPWDLSVLKMKERLQRECNDKLQTVTFWDEMMGGAPGGTIATMFAFIEGRAVKAPRAEFDPLLRLPDGSRSEYETTLDRVPFVGRSMSPWMNRLRQRWATPFIMAAVNGSVVRWSHALGRQGSKSLLYKEMAVYDDFKTAFVAQVATVMGISAMLNPFTSSLLRKYVLPKTGEGPSMDSMVNDHFTCIYGEGIGEKGNRVETVMYFDKNVGCLETSRMLVESGLCLAKQEMELPTQSGGFWTPATALGDVLLDRMIETGTTFDSRMILRENRAKL